MGRQGDRLGEGACRPSSPAHLRRAGAGGTWGQARPTRAVQAFPGHPAGCHLGSGINQDAFSWPEGELASAAVKSCGHTGSTEAPGPSQRQIQARGCRKEGGPAGKGEAMDNTTWPPLGLRPRMSSCNTQGPSRSGVHTHAPAAILSIHTVTQTHSPGAGALRPSPMYPPASV